MASGDDKKLEISIDILTQEVGSQKAEEIIQRTKEAAQDASAATVEAAKQGAAATDEFSQSAEKATENVTGLQGSSRELHVACHELNKIVPGLGSALKAAFHPEHVGIIGLVVAFEALKSVLESIKAADDIALPKFEGTEAAVSAVKSAYEKADIAARLFVEDQIRANNAGESAADIAKRQLEHYKNLAAAQTDINTARKNLGNAEIDKQEENGVITHQQALERKYALDVEYAKKRLKLEAETMAQEVAIKQRQLETEKKQLEGLAGEQKTAESKAREAEGKKASHDAKIESAKQNIAYADQTLGELGTSKGTFIKGQVNEENVTALKEYFEKYVGGNAETTSLREQFEALLKKKNDLGSGATLDFGLTKLLDSDIGQQDGAGLLAKYEGAQQQKAGAKKELDTLQKTQFDVDLNAERSKKQLAETDSAIMALEKSVKELAATIPQIKADGAAKLKNDAAVANLELHTSAVKNGVDYKGDVFAAPTEAVAATEPFKPTGTRAGRDTAADKQANIAQAHADAGQVEAAEKILSAGGKLSAEQGAMVAHVVQIMTGHAMTAAKTVEFLKKYAIDQKTRDDAFQHELDTLAAQFKNRP